MMTCDVALLILPDVSLFCITSYLGVWEVGGGGNGLNIFLSTKHSSGFGFNVEMKMEDGIHIYDVRKRVDKHENGRKGCYFLSCWYRGKKLFIFG